MLRLRKDRTILNNLKVTNKNYAYVRKMNEFYSSVHKDRSTSIGTYDKENFEYRLINKEKINLD
jgi:hypothetical protein